MDESIVKESDTMAKKLYKRSGKPVTMGMRFKLIRGGKEYAPGLKEYKEESIADDEWKGKRNYLGPGQQNYPFFPF